MADYKALSIPIRAPFHIYYKPITVKKFISGGTEGNVHQAEDHKGRVLAVKIFKDDEYVGKSPYERESIAYNIIRDANLDGVYTPAYLYNAFRHRGWNGKKAVQAIGLALVNGKRLHDFQSNRGECCDNIEATLKRGLLSFHRLGIAHGGIHSLNIMIQENSNPVWIDFGKAKFSHQPAWEMNKEDDLRRFTEVMKSFRARVHLLQGQNALDQISKHEPNCSCPKALLFPIEADLAILIRAALVSRHYGTDETLAIAEHILSLRPSPVCLQLRLDLACCLCSLGQRHLPAAELLDKRLDDMHADQWSTASETGNGAPQGAIAANERLLRAILCHKEAKITWPLEESAKIKLAYAINNPDELEGDCFKEAINFQLLEGITVNREKSNNLQSMGDMPACVGKMEEMELDQSPKAGTAGSSKSTAEDMAAVPHEMPDVSPAGPSAVEPTAIDSL